MGEAVDLSLISLEVLEVERLNAILVGVWV